MDKILGKTIADVKYVEVEGPYGSEPATELTFTDGTTHVFVHPASEN